MSKCIPAPKTQGRSAAARLAKLMALPTAPRLPPNANAMQQATYNGYWLAVLARYHDIISLQQWKGDEQWLPHYQPAL